MNLEDLLDLPLVYLKETLNTFKEIRRFTCESKRNPSEAPYIDSVIFEIRSIIDFMGIDEDKFIYQCDSSTSTFFMGSLNVSNINHTCFNNFELTDSFSHCKSFSKSSFASSNYSDFSTEESLSNLDQYLSAFSLLF